MLEKVISKLKQQGHRITPQRRAIIDKVLGVDRSFTAAEIYQLVSQQYSDIGLDTIYRNINILVDMGVLIPIVGLGKDGTRYELARHAQHHHHIVCIKCGNTTCLDFCPIDPQFLDLLRGQGYQLVRHNVELFGICAKCAQHGGQPDV